MNLKGFTKGYNIILTKRDSVALTQNFGGRKKILKPSYFNFILIFKSVSWSTFWWRTSGQREEKELGQKRNLSHQTRVGSLSLKDEEPAF